MRSILANKLRKQFASMMKQEFPYFLLYKPSKKDLDIRIGGRIFCYSLRSFLGFYIQLCIVPQWDSFFIELAWSMHERYPSMKTWIIAFNPNKDKLEGRNEGKIQLEDLLISGQMKEWWISPYAGLIGDSRKIVECMDMVIKHAHEPIEKAILNIDKLLDEVFIALQMHAIPFFKKIALINGFDLDFALSKNKK